MTEMYNFCFILRKLKAIKISQFFKLTNSLLQFSFNDVHVVRTVTNYKVVNIKKMFNIKT